MSSHFPLVSALGLFLCRVYMCVKEVKILRLVRVVSWRLTMGHGGDSYCSPEMDGPGQVSKNLFQSSIQILCKVLFLVYLSVIYSPSHLPVKSSVIMITGCLES